MRRPFTATLTTVSTTVLATGVLCYLLAAGIALSAQAAKPAAKGAAVKNPVASTPASIAAGQADFKRNCRFCHGEEARGDGPQAPKDTHPPDLTDAKWDHGSTDGEIFAVIKDGIGPKFDMKGYNSKMTPTQIWNIVNYLRSIGPAQAAR
jgi:mono/diheme cytochrome c family protein